MNASLVFTTIFERIINYYRKIKEKINFEKSKSEICSLNINWLVILVIGIAILIPIFVATVLWRPSISELVASNDRIIESMDDYENLIKSQQEIIWDDYSELNVNRYKAEGLAIDINGNLSQHEIYNSVPCVIHAPSNEPASSMIKSLLDCIHTLNEERLSIMQATEALRQQEFDVIIKRLDRNLESIQRNRKKLCDSARDPNLSEDVRNMILEDC